MKKTIVISVGLLLGAIALIAQNDSLEYIIPGNIAHSDTHDVEPTSHDDDHSDDTNMPAHAILTPQAFTPATASVHKADFWYSDQSEDRDDTSGTNTPRDTAGSTPQNEPVAWIQDAPSYDPARRDWIAGIGSPGGRGPGGGASAPGDGSDTPNESGAPGEADTPNERDVPDVSIAPDDLTITPDIPGNPIDDDEVVSVPEPSSILLLSMGIIGLAFARKKEKPAP